MSRQRTHNEFVQLLKEKNPTIKVIGHYENTSIKIECECLVCGRIWKSLPNHLLNGHSCPECAKKLIGKKNKWTHEKFVNELEKINNAIIVLSEYKGAKNRITVKCKKCGFEWTQKPVVLLSGRGCKKCANKRIGHGGGGRTQLTQEEVIKRVHDVNPNVKILGTYTKRKDPIETKCLICGNIWTPSASNLIEGYGCPKCNHGSTSYPEQFIYYAFVQMLGKDKVINRDISAIGKELDIYIPTLKFAIEFGSWTWHKDRLDKDIEKIELCKTKGITLIDVIDNCPTNFQDDRFLILPKIRSNYIILQNLVMTLIEKAGLHIETIDWEKIDIQARGQSKRLSTEEFRQRISKIHPNIEILGEYTSSANRIECKCKQCSYEWTPISGNLYHWGCPVCSGHKHPVCKFKNNETNDFVCMYDTITKPAKMNNVSIQYIKESCEGIRDDICGFNYKYLLDISNKPNQL